MERQESPTPTKNQDTISKLKDIAKRKLDLERKNIELEEEKRVLNLESSNSPVYFNDYKEKNEKELTSSFKVNPDITLELSDAEISCILSTNQLLYIGTKEGSIIQYKVNHKVDRYGKSSFRFEKLRRYHSKKGEKIEIVQMEIDERADLLFFMDKNLDGVYILSLSTLELQSQYQDLNYKWEDFKNGHVNLGQKICCFSLEREKHMVLIQIEDKTFYGFNYANREVNNQISQTPGMELVYEFHLKEICTSIYFYGEILICHFKGSTRINVYTLKRRRKSKISTKGDDNNYVWNELEDFPKMIHIQNLGLRKSICLLKSKDLVNVVYLDGIEGLISQYSAKETNFFDSKFPSKPISEDVAFSFPYVAAICRDGEETHIVFKNVLFEDRKTDDIIRTPSTITCLPNLKFITGSLEFIFVASKNIIYPILPPSNSKMIEYFQKNYLPDKKRIYDDVFITRKKNLLEQKRTIAHQLNLKDRKGDALTILFKILDEIIEIDELKEDKVKKNFILDDINQIISTLPDWVLVREYALNLMKRNYYINECIFIGKPEKFSWYPKVVIDLIKEFGTLKSLEKYLKYLIEEERCILKKYHTIYLETLIKIYLQDTSNADLHILILSIIENSSYYDKEKILPILTQSGMSYEASLVEALIEQSLLEKLEEEKKEQPLEEEEDELDEKEDKPSITITDEKDIVQERRSGKPRKSIIQAIQKMTSLRKSKQPDSDKSLLELSEEEFDNEMEIFLNEKSIMNENSRRVFHSLSKEKKIVIYESWKEEKKKMKNKLKTITSIRLIETKIPSIKETKFIKEFNDYLNANGIFDEKIRQTLYLLSMEKKYVLLESYKLEKQKEEKRKLEEAKLKEEYYLQQQFSEKTFDSKKKMSEKEKMEKLAQEEISNEDLNRKMNIVADKMGIIGDARKKFLDLPKDQKVVIIGQHKKINPNLIKEFEIKEIERPVIDREYTGYTVNFLSVFSVKTMKDGFIKHLKLESNAEPFEFLLELNRVPKEISKESIDKFIFICDEFIVTKAPREINIFGGDRHKVLKIKHDYLKNNNTWPVKETPSEVLEKIRRTLFNDLRLDTFPRFLSSKYGYDCVMQNATNPMVVTKDPLFVLNYKLKNSTFLGQNLKEEEISELALNLSHSHKLKEKYIKFKSIKDLSEEERKKLKVPIRILLFEEEVEKQVKTRGFKDLISLKFENEKEHAPIYFTSALLIGTTVFEWNDTDICIPREYDPKEVSIEFQVDTDLTFDHLEENLPDFLNTIIEWNSTKRYELEGGDKKKVGNSQDFIEALLRSLDVKMVLPFYSPCHEVLIKKIKDKGYTKLFFKSNSEFTKIFNLKNEEYSFKTHEKFDEFVNGLFSIDKILDVNHPGEYVWFKSIDRYFSTKHKLLVSKKRNSNVPEEKLQPILILTPTPESTKNNETRKRKSLSMLNNALDIFKDHKKESSVPQTKDIDSRLKDEIDKVKPSNLCHFK